VDIEKIRKMLVKELKYKITDRDEIANARVDALIICCLAILHVSQYKKDILDIHIVMGLVEDLRRRLEETIKEANKISDIRYIG